MIPEEYVTFETARLLKAAGFPQDDCLYKAYDSDGDLYARMWEVESECYAAPSQAQAMRWLRDDCHLAIVIEYTSYNGWEYTLLLDYDTDCSRMVCSVGADTYEAAAEAGIKTACEYLKNNETGRT